MSINGQGHFFTIYFPGFVLVKAKKVSVYRTIGPLVMFIITRKITMLLLAKRHHLKVKVTLFSFSLNLIYPFHSCSVSNILHDFSDHFWATLPLTSVAFSKLCIYLNLYV